MTDNAIFPIINRPAEGDTDYWQIHRLLLESVPLAPVGFNWDMRRWEGKRFYDADPAGDPNWAKGCQVWVTAVKQIIALAHPDGPGWPYLEIHPDFRFLEPEMLDWAEANLAAMGETGRSLHFFVYEYDAYRARLLTERGYEKMAFGGVIRHLRLGHGPLAEPKLAPGYTLRATNPEDEADCQQIADLLNAAFNRDFHNAAEYQNFCRNAPSYRNALDLVAVGENGRFAAYVGIPYDELNRRGIFEPVCTHPDHQKRGLGKALMQEGLRRLRALGAVDVTVETGDMVAANALYDSLGFTEVYRGSYWRKEG